MEQEKDGLFSGFEPGTLPEREGGWKKQAMETVRWFFESDDDCVCKDFEMKDEVARVAAALRNAVDSLDLYQDVRIATRGTKVYICRKDPEEQR